MSTAREKLGALLSFAVLASILGGCYYIITHTKPDPADLPKPNTQCSELIYFNKLHNSIDTAYVRAELLGDSLMSFESPDGVLWARKQVISYATKKLDYGYQMDLTVSGGQRFRITPIDSGGCRIKSKMDSIKNQLTTDDEPDYN